MIHHPISTTIVLFLLLMYRSAVADAPPAPASEPPTSPDPVPASPGSPPASPAPASPSESPAPARPDFASVKSSLVIVRDGAENTARQAPGFGISDQGHIVTYVDSLRDRQSYQVSNAEGQIFSAERLAVRDNTDLMILKLSGSSHGVTALTFAKTALHAAAPLYAVRFNPSDSERFTRVPGTVTQLVNTEQGQMIQHNALFSLTSAGMPLLNRCFQAVGVNVLEKERRVFQRDRDIDPLQKGSASSLAAVSLGGLLTSIDLTLPMADTECLSPEEERHQEQEQARQAREAERQREQEAAAQRVREVEEANQHRLEEAQRRQDAAEERARQAGAETQRIAQETQRQLEQQEQDQQAELQRQQDTAQRREAALQREVEEEAEQQRQILLVGSTIGGLALLGVALLIRRKQKRLRTTEQEKQNISGALDRAQSELSGAAARDRLRDSAPDVFLESRSPPIALKIPGASLVDQPGAIVGRSPSESTCVINHEQISRRHFRLALVSQQLMIEDLGSTNGTSVNGALLEPGQKTPVNDGSRVLLGALELTLHLGR